MEKYLLIVQIQEKVLKINKTWDSVKFYYFIKI